MRPIVSAVNSPCHKIAAYIAKALTPHVGQSDTFVRDSRHFVELIENIQVQETDLLVGFDVKSLSTKVPVPETIELINAILPADLANIPAVCLTSTYFFFDGSFYEQLEGAAMGSPLSPVVANLYMEHFEQKAINSFELKPKTFLRYVDDTFVIWPLGVDNINRFLAHLNFVHPSIQYTMEVENNNTLPFLDVLVIRKNGSLGHTVYRKPTHTDRYLNADSHHHPAQKQAVLSTLANRAIKSPTKNTSELKNNTS
uniref:Reverse transcriptase domain-containing protein n=1 Tax=Clastoptera arizonana TaxID=38151 RepID=A0A1B6D9B7_9HEMI